MTSPTAYDAATAIAGTPSRDKLKPRIAVVEDDGDLRDGLVDYLTAQGYAAWGAASAAALYRSLVVDAAQVILVDIGLPDEDGLAIVRHLRRLPHLAIVILSGRDGIDDRLAGLACGADAYLVKPVDPRELVATIDAVWRRLRPGAGAPPPPAAGGDAWFLDQERWLLRPPDGAAICLTSKEFHLLECLFEAGGRLVRKAAIAARMGGGSGAADYHRIDVLVARLRKKGQAATGRALPIKTVTAHGYLFSAPCARRTADFAGSGAVSGREQRDAAP